MRQLAALACAAALLAGCRSTPARCGFADFPIGSSHMSNSIATPFVIRELRGRIIPRDAPPDLSDWSWEGAAVRFQINGPNGFSLEVPVAHDGTFHVPNLRPGRYCFKTTSTHFQGYEGVIVIHPRAVAETMTIELAIGA